MQLEIMGNWPELNEQPVLTLDLQRRYWRYRGEGNANLVLSLPDVGWILRLHKYDREKVFTERESLEELERGLQEAIFCHSVMVPLIGSAYIQPPVLAHIDQVQVQSLNYVLSHYQPAHRKNKGIKFGNIAIYPDYTLLPLHTDKFVQDVINMNGLIKSDVSCDLGNESLLNVSQFRTKNDIELHRILVGDLSAKPRLPCNQNELTLEKHIGDLPVSGFRFDQRTFKCSQKDRSRSSIFCVEIKPKQGWIPSMDRCKPKCTFCLTQYLKLTEGNIDGISQYCPLDLFSGDEKRMKKALRSLLEQPQNNLKIFQDGDLIYSDVHKDSLEILRELFEQPSSPSEEEEFDRVLDKFCDLVYRALTTDATDGEPGLQVEDLSTPEVTTETLTHPPVFTQSCDWSSQPLPENCVLDRILKIQKLQQFGLEVVYKMYRNLGPETTDYAYVKTLCNQRESKKLVLNPIQRYLLATTAKDCSVLIALKQFSKKEMCCDDHKTLTDSDGLSFVWNVGVSDLDPKPLSCIEKHWKRDMNVISAYARHLKKT